MDARVQALLQQYEPEMGGYPASLPREFQKALETVAPLLPADGDLAQWADDGIALARQSLRSWEAAAEYFRVAPLVLRLAGDKDWGCCAIRSPGVRRTRSSIASRLNLSSASSWSRWKSVTSPTAPAAFRDAL